MSSRKKNEDKAWHHFVQHRSLHWYLDALWYHRHPLRWVLWPISWIYWFATTLRRLYLRRICQRKFPIPVVVVGNISVGGVGKTPLVVALASALQARGLRVGIVSRGYGAQCRSFPHEVVLTDRASYVGDEPLLLAHRTRCPIVIAPHRVQAVEYLLQNHRSQVVISDDGLQHYRMGRTVEIAVVDAMRGLGNGLCLPAGPLRERAARLNDVDFVVVNGEAGFHGHRHQYQMSLRLGGVTSLTSGAVVDIRQLRTPIVAVAAIGHPGRFFKALHELGLSFEAHAFPDHHAFEPSDFCWPDATILMTEKDAVKCQSFALDSMYYLPVSATLPEVFWQAFYRLIS